MSNPIRLFKTGTLLIVAIVVACAGVTLPTVAQEKIAVAVLMSNAGDPYFANKSYGYQVYANEDEGIELEFFNAGGYDKLEVQIRQIENAITREVDVMLVTPIDAKGVLSGG